jgi:heterodisulfide reductase subunit C
MDELTRAIDTIAHTVTGRCYQCGRCSGNCPLAPEMDVLPHQVTSTLMSGSQDDVLELLKARTVWLCDGCRTCTERCPREIDVAAVFDALRQVTTHRDAPLALFNVSLLTGVRRMGRVNEIPLGIHFNLSARRGLFAGVGDALHLLKRGKLPIIPHRAGNLSDLFRRVEGGDGR